MKAYSYHTFILPFIWEKSASDTGYLLENQYGDWQKKYRNSPDWEELYIRKDDGKISLAGEISIEDFYKEYKYFHPHICEAIYGTLSNETGNLSSQSIVTNFSLRPGGKPLSGSYRIRCGDREYVLDVYAIELRIYTTGAGLYVIKCRNTLKNQFDLNSVKDINDYGRRITLPVMNNPVCADELELDLKDLGAFAENWSVIKSRAAEMRFDTLSYISNIVTGPMGVADTDISLGIDDRMFVLSWTTDAEKTIQFTEKKEDEREYPFIADEKLSKDFYELAAVDSAGTCSCDSYEMRKELLGKYVYFRWIDSGSIYTVAAQAFNALSSAEDDGPVSFLPENFITQYYQMSCLCLAQRTSLINFSRKAEKISKGIERRKDTINRRQIQEMMDLQERYIAFLTQIDSTEASPEEQGIELYGMLRERLNIETEKATLQEQLTGLSDLADASQSFSFSKLGHTVAVAAFVLSLGQLITDCITEHDSFALEVSLVLVALVIVVAGFVWARIGRRN